MHARACAQQKSRTESNGAGSHAWFANTIDPSTGGLRLCMLRRLRS
jgi:hypothetical protein